MDVSQNQIKAVFEQIRRLNPRIPQRLGHIRKQLTLPPRLEESEHALAIVISEFLSQDLESEWDEVERNFLFLFEDAQLYRKMLRITMSTRTICTVGICGSMASSLLGDDEIAFDIDTLKAIDDGSSMARYALQVHSDACLPDSKRLAVLINLAVKEFSDAWRDTWAATATMTEECCCCLAEPVSIKFASCDHSCICGSCRTKLIVKHHGQTEKRRYGSVSLPCPLCRCEGRTVQIR
jgi:hypothetical protein